MAEAVDWKRRHLEGVLALETLERRWRGIEQALRRLVGRLCMVAMGDDAELDSQLQKIASVVRKETDERELRELFESLTDAVRALDQDMVVSATTRSTRLKVSALIPETSLTIAMPAPPASAEVIDSLLTASPAAPTATEGADVPTEKATGFTMPLPQPRWAASCDGVSTLLDQLASTPMLVTSVAELRSEMAGVRDDATLAVVLAKTADLVAGHGAALTRERTEIAATLSRVTERLNEMAVFLGSASAERQRQHADTSSMNSDVLAQMRRLGTEVSGSTDLGDLQQLVAHGLETMAVSVRQFEESEQRRFDCDAERTQQMQTRIVDLEQEAQALKGNLEQERRRSRIDSLTKLANRVSFEERLAAELARWRRSRTPVAVLVLDIDHFKSINDACGHRGGDAVLREVAECLKRTLREGDFLARFGGEEFVGILTATAFAQAVQLADHMRRSIAGLKFHLRGTPVQVTVSCGLTELRDGDSAHSVFDRADAALYKAKNSGRNACVAG